MSRSNLLKLARTSGRHLSTRSFTTTRSSFIRPPAFLTTSHSTRIALMQGCRVFSTSRASYKGISPESENPQPKKAQNTLKAAAPAELTIEEYNELSDVYMDSIVERLEQLQEERDDVDVEYSAGVLTLSFPPIGTYVINKQPPNKQIWLSSPISGPKRYDYVIVSEGQDSKEGTGAGNWVYLRDMSTLSGLLLSEVGVDLSEPMPPPSQSGE